MTNIADTSIDAYRRIPNGTLKTQCDRIVEIVRDSGWPDMSLQEIKVAYRERFRQAIELSSVSGRVNSLVGTRLERREETRPCRVTGRHVHPVRIPLPGEQRGLFQ